MNSEAEEANTEEDEVAVAMADETDEVAVEEADIEVNEVEEAATAAEEIEVLVQVEE